MKSILLSIFCIILAALAAFSGIVYADYAIKEDGFSGHKHFINLTEETLEICFFGQVKRIDISKIKKIIVEFTSNRMKFNVVDMVYS